MVYRENGAIIRYPGNTTVATVSSYTVGDVLGMAIDSTNVRFYKNNILQGTYAHGYSKDYFVTALNVPNTGTSTMTANFGQKPFKYAPPEDFQPLNAANVRPETVISRPDQYVGVTTYTGNDAATHHITGLNFSAVPDFVWIKNIDQSEKHILHDTVRDIGNTLYSNNSDQADTGATYSARFKSFDFNGFTVGTTHSGTNSDGDDFIAWCWKAGGNKNTFNIDDVGYANASDVGMNIGGQNSNAYNQTETWSSTVSGRVAGSPYDATKMFDGNLTTYTDHVVQNSTITWTRTLTSVTSLRVYIHQGNSTGTVTTVGANGTQVDTISANFGPGWHNIALRGTIYSITFARGGSGNPLSIYAVEVNGVMYVDNGVTPPNVPSIAVTGASVGTKQGFSIVRYTGTYSSQPTTLATVSHGLLQSPDFIITKSTNNTNDNGYWNVYHSSLNVNQFLRLGSTAAVATISSGAGGDIAAHPTKTTFNTYYYSGSGNSGSDYIGYVWHDVPGLQKFGQYEGNTTEGAFVELGFRPAIIWIKAIDQTWYWNVQDAERSPINPSKGNFLRFDTTATENAASGNNNIDFLSNGFKIRSTTNQSEPTNVNGQTYIYAAWAEAPTVNLFGAQSNAR